ncbi:MAG: Xaa-Pro peptidase family protein [archaeon]
MEIGKLQKLMRAAGLGCWLTVSAECSDKNSEILLGRKVSGLHFLCIPAKGKSFVLVGRMEADAVRAPFSKIIFEKRAEAEKLLRKKIPARAKIALNFSKRASCDYLTLSQFRFLKKALPGRRFISSEKLQELRAIRTSAEVQNHRKAIQITGRALELEKKKGFAGRTEGEIAFSIKKTFLELGADEAFETIVASGKNSADPHHKPGKRKVRANEPLLIDFGAKVGGSCADITRTFWVGKKPTELFKKAYSSVLRAQEKSIELVQAGAKGREINDFSVKLLKKNFPEKAVLHSLGHSLGALVHEAGPGLFSKEKRALLENQIVTVEPGLYFPGKFGVRIEDDILVGKRPLNLSGGIRKEKLSQ